MGAKDLNAALRRRRDPPDPSDSAAHDRGAISELVQRLYPEHRLSQIEDGTLFEQADPPERHVYAGCFPGLTVVCTQDAALERPSELDTRFLDEAGGRTLPTCHPQRRRLVRLRDLDRRRLAAPGPEPGSGLRGHGEHRRIAALRAAVLGR